MTKPFFSVLCAAGLVAALFIFVRSATYTLRPDEERTRRRLENFYAEPKDSLDAVFIGSSAVYASVSPLRLYRQTGITSAVYATPNQSLSMIPYVLKECRKTQPRALYVIELRAALASEEDRRTIAADIRRQTDNMPWSLLRGRMILELVPPSEQLLHAADLLRYHGRWKEVRPEDLRFTWGRADAMKGWTFISRIEPLSMAEEWKSNARLSLPAESEQELRLLAEYCLTEKVQVIFFAAPFPLSRKQAKQYNEISGILEEYGFPFINMNRKIRELGLDWQTDFYDYRHTNMSGAARCTDFIGEQLLGQLTPSGFRQEWDVLLPSYNSREEACLREIRGAETNDL